MHPAGCPAFPGHADVRTSALPDNEPMSMLTCSVCSEELDPTGPGVSSHRDRDSREWVSYWTPFIEDLRGTPQRLVHPRCFADESGFDALIALVTEHDRRMRLELSSYW